MPSTPTVEAAARLRELVASGEQWLMRRILEYARERDYTKYTSTLEEAWRLSISGLSASLLTALDHGADALELGPDEDLAADPSAAFGILEAQRHRERGTPLGMFLGLMKYYRQCYVDLAAQSAMPPEVAGEVRRIVERFFDRVEIGFCVEWAAIPDQALLAELQSATREITNEKNKYLTVFESLPQPVILLDAGHRVDNLNHAAARLRQHGVTPGATYYAARTGSPGGTGRDGADAGAHVRDSFPWLADAIEAFGRDAAAPAEFETKLEDAAGVRHFVVRLHRMLDVSGKFHGTVVTLGDVTERRAAEERERAASGEVSAILESISDAFFSLDRNTVVRYFNAAAERVLGRRREEVLGRPLFDAFPEARGSVFEQRYRHALADGVALSFEVHFGVAPYANWYNVRVYPHRDGISVYFEVTTERKTAELALRASEERLRAITDTAADAIVSADEQGLVVAWNRAAESMFRRSAAEMLGRPLDGLMPEGFRAGHAAGHARLVAGGEPRLLGRTNQLVGVRADGSEFPLELSLSAWNHGDRHFFTGIIRDVSERTRLEQQFRQAQKMEAVGQLAGGVAHDFNNMLMAIRAATEVLQRRSAATDPIQHELTTIHRTVDRATEVVQRLLAFARRQILQPVTLDLNDVVAETVRMLRATFPENVAIAFRPDTAARCVCADRAQLVQILLNLCLNSRDAMPGGGAIAIETGAVTFDENYLAMHPWAQAGEYAVLALSDTGQGIDAATLPHIFEPFFTTKGEGKGSGLGLSTVYGIVKQHGGTINVYSEPGHGTTVRVYLPLVEGAGSAVEHAADDRPIEGGTETVLVVEDEIEVRRILVEVLSGLGYRVFEAGDGEHALAIVRRLGRELDLVVTDVVMPRMGGQELADAARQTYPDLRFLFSSGYTENVVHVGFVKKEGLHFIAKPYGIDALARKVREVLATRTSG